MEIRETKLKLEKRVYLTKKAYKILRQQKRKQKKSMAEIACDLIKENFKE